MKRNTFIFAAMAAVLPFCTASCDKENSMKDAPEQEISFMNGVHTKGYVDGATFFEKATADLHDPSAVTAARSMQISAYVTPQSGAPGNYFVNETFAQGGDSKWHHTPALYWPVASQLDFLAVSATTPFDAADMDWYPSNASVQVRLDVDETRTQDDILVAAAQMNSDAATTITTGGGTTTYATGQSVGMVFEHTQAWIEFQLSVASAEMTDRIAIKEIVVENAARGGELLLTRDGVTVKKDWALDDQDDFVFDDTYGVYGRSKEAEDYVTEYGAVQTAKAALEAAIAGGDAADIATRQTAYDAAQEALQAAVKTYALVNPINAVGGKNDRTDADIDGTAETATNCAYLDMLLPQQTKTAFIIRYVLAGQPNVLEYRYTFPGTSKWEMGRKYVYDIDFVISEITVSPTVKPYVATFDSTELTPVELQ